MPSGNRLAISLPCVTSCSISSARSGRGLGAYRTPDGRLRYPGLDFVRTSVHQPQAALHPGEADGSHSQLLGFSTGLFSKVADDANALVFPMFPPLRDKELGVWGKSGVKLGRGLSGQHSSSWGI
ncbi:hypothetical protein IG631_07127 [Alternaria alternata]|nr:hypothetical protein IG631_07127 [Alternaria alternata]